MSVLRREKHARPSSEEEGLSGTETTHFRQRARSQQRRSFLGQEAQKWREGSVSRAVSKPPTRNKDRGIAESLRDNIDTVS